MTRYLLIALNCCDFKIPRNLFLEIARIDLEI